MEKHSFFDLEKKYGEDVYSLNFLLYGTQTIRELSFRDLETLYVLLDKVVNEEKERRKVTDKRVKEATFTEK